MINAQDEEGFISFETQLAAGDTVRVTSGPFTDQLAVIEKLSGTERVRVLLSFAEQAVRVDLSARDVAPVNSS